ncbi:MAG TPA: ECF-type sigma factor [Sphingomonas sp.]|nr:ECF-type sigma factor [Sphingomonas sp.]
MEGPRQQGSEELVTELLAQCYEDVRRVARRMIASDGQRRVLQATELAHEAVLRLIGTNRMEIRDSAHMLALAARTMRRVLIDEARKGLAAKRQTPAMITCWPDAGRGDLISIQDLDRALAALELVSPEHAEIVELRFMLGLTVEEASQASGIPERTVKRRWQAARAWLLDHLKGDDPGR